MTTMSFLAKIFRSKPNSYRHRLSLAHRFESSKPEVQEQVMVTQLSEEFDETDEDREERIEKLRNKSRLSSPHRNIIHGKVPYPESKAYFHDSVQYKRRSWARYGSEQSKVYPGIAWPDKEELESRKEYEQVLNPLSIQEMLAIETNIIAEKERKAKERYNEILKNDKNNEKIIEEYHQKLEKKAAEASESKQKKDKLFNEIRAHFGFNIDPRDEKFQEMIEIKKKEELKKRRQEKKKMREEKLITMALEMENQTGDSKDKKETKEESAKNKNEST